MKESTKWLLSKLTNMTSINRYSIIFFIKIIIERSSIGDNSDVPQYYRKTERRSSWFRIMDRKNIKFKYY